MTGFLFLGKCLLAVGHQLHFLLSPLLKWAANLFPQQNQPESCCCSRHAATQRTRYYHREYSWTEYLIFALLINIKTHFSKLNFVRWKFMDWHLPCYSNHLHFLSFQSYGIGLDLLVSSLCSLFSLVYSSGFISSSFLRLPAYLLDIIIVAFIISSSSRRRTSTNIFITWYMNKNCCVLQSFTQRFHFAHVRFKRVYLKNIVLFFLIIIIGCCVFCVFVCGRTFLS